MNELEDLNLGLQSQTWLESMLSDPDCFGFPDQLACLRTQDTYPPFREACISRLTSTAGAEWVIAPTEITSTPVLA